MRIGGWGTESLVLDIEKEFREGGNIVLGERLA